MYEENINQENHNTLKITSIVVGMILVVGIGVLAFIFLNNPEPVEKCGDGVCDEIEQQKNPGIMIVID